MRRFTSAALSLITMGVLTSLVACATSVDDPIGTDDQNATEPTGAKVPAPAPSSTPDAGAPKDSGTSTKDSSTPPPPQDSGTTTGEDCDTSDPIKALMYQLDLAGQASPVPCPCSAGQCCLMAIACVKK